MIAKSLMIFWSIVALVLWAFMTSKNFNLLISLGIAIWFCAYLVHLLNGGALHEMRRVLRGHWTASICLSAGLVTSIMLTSMIAGDWSPEHRIASVCVGPLHIHHWTEGFALCAWHARLCGHLFRRRWLSVRRYGIRSIEFAIGLACLSGMCRLLNIGNASLQISLVAISMYIFMLGTLCQTHEVSTIWFKRYLALSLGIAMGIAISGGAGMFRDFIHGGKIPSALIFWNTEPDPACR